MYDIWIRDNLCKSKAHALNLKPERVGFTSKWYRNKCCGFHTTLRGKNTKFIDASISNFRLHLFSSPTDWIMKFKILQPIMGTLYLYGPISLHSISQPHTHMVPRGSTSCEVGAPSRACHTACTVTITTPKPTPPRNLQSGTSWIKDIEDCRITKGSILKNISFHV